MYQEDLRKLFKALLVIDLVWIPSFSTFAWFFLRRNGFVEPWFLMMFFSVLGVVFVVGLVIALVGIKINTPKEKEDRKDEEPWEIK